MSMRMPSLVFASADLRSSQVYFFGADILIRRAARAYKRERELAADKFSARKTCRRARRRLNRGRSDWAHREQGHSPVTRAGEVQGCISTAAEIAALPTLVRGAGHLRLTTQALGHGSIRHRSRACPSRNQLLPAVNVGGATKIDSEDPSYTLACVHTLSAPFSRCCHIRFDA